MYDRTVLFGAAALLGASCIGSAASAKAPDAIDLYFASGSSAIRPQDEAYLDRASRLYDEGKPIVMVVAGSADPTGPPGLNLRLSQERADQVVRALVARGIPVERLQVLAKGVSDPPVPAQGRQPKDRRVEITWR
ncbi:OmpA family protein [Lichenicoccus sp.]|uniref:OmpA family protein n=1 Tax=Lichenicoccus sp. TaxID=2781899 RepID=UPI003D0D397B